MKRFLNLIVAADVDGCIGQVGPEPLVWKQRADMMRFKKLTTGQVVIMGRNTFESLGKPLSDRINIVITSRFKDELLKRGDVVVADSLEEACSMAHTIFPNRKPFLIGGGMVYNEAIQKDMVRKFYITVVKTKIDGDAIVKFPDFSNLGIWEHELLEAVDADERNQFKSVFMDIRRK